MESQETVIEREEVLDSPAPDMDAGQEDEPVAASHEVDDPDDDDWDDEDEADYDFVSAPVNAQEAEYDEIEPLDDDRPSGFPSALMSQFTKQIIGAGMAFIITIVLIFTFHTPQCMLGFILVGYLLYCAWALRRDFAKGKIEEISVVCSSVTNMGAKNACRVVFRSVMESETETPVYYEFYVPGRQNTNSAIVPNLVYIIYFRPTDPKKLLGYFQV